MTETEAAKMIEGIIGWDRCIYQAGDEVLRQRVPLKQGKAN